MTEKQKYLIGFVLGVLGIGVIWFGWIGKGEPTTPVPPSPSPRIEQKSSPSPDKTRDSEEATEDEEVTATRPLVERFLKTYLSFQGDQPEQHIEAVKPFVTADLYDDLNDQPPRPTADMVAQRWIRFTNAHGIQSGSRVEWSMGAVVEVTDHTGSKRAEEWTYVVSLVQDNGWKVTEVIQRGSVD